MAGNTFERDLTLKEIYGSHGRIPDQWHATLDTNPDLQRLRDGSRQFARKWAKAKKEHGDAQPFWTELLQLLGWNPPPGTMEVPAARHSTGETGSADVFVPGLFIVENKSPQRAPQKALDDAEDQAWDYVNAHFVVDARKASITPAITPRYVIACNLVTFRVLDRLTATVREFRLADLPRNLDAFGFITGWKQARSLAGDVEVDRKAAALMGGVYDAMVLDAVDAELAAATTMRVLFLAVAEDLHLLGKPKAFTVWLQNEVKPDGSDLGAKLTELFSILDAPLEKRPASLAASALGHFPYINGSLFANAAPVYLASSAVYQAILQAVDYQWDSVDAAIFGAMFQRLRSREDRHDLGQHYTSEADILKVIGPLFLDDLHAAFDAARNINSATERRRSLRNIKDRMSRMRFLDPASGSGNFLLVTYKHLSTLDLQITQAIRETKGVGDLQVELDAENELCLSLSQFHGIEIDAWPAELGKTALYIARAQLNARAREELGDIVDTTFPLPTLTIWDGVVHANALTTSWDTVCPIDEDTYIMGNPPFLGAVLIKKDLDQLASVQAVWGGNKGQGTVDLVGSWLLLAGRWVKKTGCHCAFVATNSITQGEQPPPLWEAIGTDGIEISFAYRTFPWRNGAPGTAAVHCVIIGLEHKAQVKPRLYHLAGEDGGFLRDDPGSINAYLVPGGLDELVIPTRVPRSANQPRMLFGSMARDDGHLANIDPEIAASIRTNDPIAAKYLRRIVGSRELLHNEERWCLWLASASPQDLHDSKTLRERLAKVRDFRLKSSAGSTRAWAERPGEFVQQAQPPTTYIAVPGVSSERYRYVPMGYMPPDVIASNALLTVASDDLYVFGLLVSRPFDVWHRTVSGRLKSDMRMSAEVTYHNFPFPDPPAAQLESIRTAAAEVLSARASHPESNLAALYSETSMPQDLLSAHRALDAAVLAAFGLAGSAADMEILTELFARYRDLRLQEQLDLSSAPRRRTRRR